MPSAPTRILVADVNTDVPISDMARADRLCRALRLAPNDAWVSKGHGRVFQHKGRTLVAMTPLEVSASTGHEYEGIDDSSEVAHCESPVFSKEIKVIADDMMASGAISGEWAEQAGFVLRNRNPKGPDQVTIIAREPSNGCAVGFLVATRDLLVEDDGVALYQVKDIFAYVAPTHRKRGFGAAMLTCLNDQVQNDIERLADLLNAYKGEAVIRTYLDIRDDDPIWAETSDWLHRIVEEEMHDRMVTCNENLRNPKVRFDTDIHSEMMPSPNGP